MDENTDDDNLTASTSRLGDRFAQSATDENEPEEMTSDTGSDTSESTSQSSADVETDLNSEYVPTTLYLPEDTRRDFRRFLKRLTLDHPEIEDAQKRELHTALIRASMEHPAEIAELAEEKMQ
jgi:hypothetical protein